MTADQFEALARIMRLRANSSAYAGLKLVLVDGLKHTEAAEVSGAARQNITKMVGRAREVVQDAQMLADVDVADKAR